MLIEIRSLVFSFLEKCDVCNGPMPEVWKCFGDSENCSAQGNMCYNCFGDLVTFYTHEGPHCRNCGEEWYDEEFNSW